jgi:Tfp pilus assembly protein PilF
VSRIHEALRRGRPAAAPVVARAAQADAVLAALGYRSGRSSGGRTPLLLASTAVAVLATIVVWLYWPAPTPSLPAVSTPKPLPPARLAGAAPAKTLPPVVVTPPVKVPPAAVPAAAATPAAVTAIAPVSAHSAPRLTTRRPEPMTTPDAEPVPTKEGGRSTAPFSDLQLALYYHRTGDFEQALVHYRRVLQRDELNVEAHNNLGVLYQGKGLYDDASREFQRVIAIDPVYLTAHLNLSAALLGLGRADAAAAEARAVLALDPRRSDALVNLALAQAAAGLPGDAQLSLRRALEIDPHHAAAHYNLAQAYDKAGEARLAADHYRQFLQYAGPEQAVYLADVRARLQALARGTR